MADYADIALGLLGGLGEGVKSYSQTMKANKAIDAEMAAKGMKLDPATGQYLPDPAFEARKRRDRQSELMLKARLEGLDLKFKPDSDEIESMSINPEWAKLKKELAASSGFGDPYGLKAMQAEEARRKAEQSRKGEKLPSDKLLLLSEGRTGYQMLENLPEVVKQSQKMFGPLSGVVAEINPYDVRGQSLNSQLRTIRQTIGKFMEGGVLRAEDEKKYRDMLPKLTDTPDVAQNKITLVRKLLADKYNESVKTLQGSGYDISGIPPVESPSLPGFLGGAESKGLLQPSGGAEGEIKEWQGKRYKRVGDEWVEVK